MFTYNFLYWNGKRIILDEVDYQNSQKIESLWDWSILRGIDPVWCVAAYRTASHHGRTTQAVVPTSS
jgi:hypothetical protein